MGNIVSITTLVLQDQRQGYIFVDTSFLFLQPHSLQIYLNLEILLNFLSKLYIPPWLGKIFKFLVFKLLEDAFASHKIGSGIFLLMPPGEFLPQVLVISSPQAEGNYTSPHAVFFENLSPSRRGGACSSSNANQNVIFSYKIILLYCFIVSSPFAAGGIDFQKNTARGGISNFFLLEDNKNLEESLAQRVHE